MTDSHATPTTDTHETTAPSRLPLLGSFIVGLVCAYLVNFVAPGMFRLSSLAFLLFYLGLFFYLLYGLLIGAIMFRVGRSARPAPKGLLVLIGLVVVVAVWGGGLYQEYRALPEIAVNVVREQIKGRVTREQIEDIRIGVAQAIAEQWQRDYPPGGFMGYLKWMATEKPLEVPYVVREGTCTIPARQQGAGFIFRVVVSLGLLIFSILSQFIGLSVASKPVPRTLAEAEGVAEDDGGTRENTPRPSAD